jgi:hypothetical protein
MERQAGSYACAYRSFWTFRIAKTPFNFLTFVLITYYQCNGPAKTQRNPGLVSTGRKLPITRISWGSWELCAESCTTSGVNLQNFQLGWLTRLGRRARLLIVVPAFVSGAGKYRQARILRKSRVGLAELTEPEHGPFARLNYL